MRRKLIVILLFFALFYIFWFGLYLYEHYYFEDTFNELVVNTSIEEYEDTLTITVDFSNKLPPFSNNELIILNSNPDHYIVEKNSLDTNLKFNKQQSIQSPDIYMNILTRSPDSLKIRYKKEGKEIDDSTFVVTIKSKFKGKTLFKYLDKLIVANRM
ncbi:hypothetical protein [Bacillus sp. SM2101]|uniref:hypothetical protein n=1 Tax=Bacillus sp. SM2101 TaxID=2805366 RepID=UPI001BDF6BAA|nr:hypothetical protein [Bacillus sp. SM2101]